MKTSSAPTSSQNPARAFDRSLTRRRAMKLAATGCIGMASLYSRSAASESAEMVGRGRQFLVDMFDPSVDLLPEFAGSNTYWLYHDNYLAAKMLDPVAPALAERIRKSIASYRVHDSGKIEIVFGEAKRPLPFRQHDLVDVARVGDKIIKTEKLTDRVLRGWEEYADLLLLAAMAETDRRRALGFFDRARDLWDGRGLADRVVEVNHIYATYKLGLLLLAAHRLDQPLPMKSEVLAQLARLQNEAGGWITDYTEDGTPRGFANVETTCLVLLGFLGGPGQPSK